MHVVDLEFRINQNLDRNLHRPTWLLSSFLVEIARKLSYSGEVLLETLVVGAQTGGLWERHAGSVAPVPFTVAALGGGGVRPLEELLPHCIIGVGGWTGPGGWHEALHLSGLCLAEGGAHVLCTESVLGLGTMEVGMCSFRPGPASG